MGRKIILAGVLMAIAGLFAWGEHLVILHTNDTHSNIEPDSKGVGGILQRKALIDSVRKAEKNVILADAGDIVQGTLYFNFFRGDVEYPLFNMMDYDIRILGNHEFDNGLEELAAHWKDVKGSRLSANYDFTSTPAAGLFEPYTIKKVGKKKVGFIGINVDPYSLISEHSYQGMKYSDAIETANHYAKILKEDKGCDLVVAVTHIGYTTDVNGETDVDLAKESRDIDIIIGGHSHTVVNPDEPGGKEWLIPNADGKPVVVAQTGRYGKYLGYIKIDLDNIGKKIPEYKLLPVTDRFPMESLDARMKKYIEPYKEKVDSVNNHVIAYATEDMDNNDRNGAYANWIADFLLDYSEGVAARLGESDDTLKGIDFAISNCGGIRQPLRKGPVTEGGILSTFPFANYVTIIRIKGKDVKDALQIASHKGGEAISRNLRVATDKDGNINHVVLNGEELDPEKEYVVATIDYLSNGNDGLTSLANNELIWQDTEMMNVRILDYLKRLTSFGLPMEADSHGRFIQAAD